MNQHSAPPGDWQPPEPPWLQEVRDLVASADRISKKIEASVVGHARKSAAVCFGSAMGGYFVGFAVVELLKWWAGVK